MHCGIATAASHMQQPVPHFQDINCWGTSGPARLPTKQACHVNQLSVCLYLGYTSIYLLPLAVALHTQVGSVYMSQRNHTQTHRSNQPSVFFLAAGASQPARPWLGYSVSARHLIPRKVPETTSAFQQRQRSWRNACVLILSHFTVTWTLLDVSVSCCPYVRLCLPRCLADVHHKTSTQAAFAGFLSLTVFHAVLISIPGNPVACFRASHVSDGIFTCFFIYRAPSAIHCSCRPAHRWLVARFFLSIVSCRASNL